MDTPRDPWLQEQIDRFGAVSATQAALYHQEVRLLSARQLLATHLPSRRLGFPAWLLYWLVGHFRRSYPLAQKAPQSNAAVTFDVTPDNTLGVVTSATTETDESAMTVIVVGLQPYVEGE